MLFQVALESSTASLPPKAPEAPPIVIPTSGHRKELIEKMQGRKGEQEAQFELIFQVNMFSVFSYHARCKELCFWD